LLPVIDRVVRDSVAGLLEGISLGEHEAVYQRRLADRILPRIRAMETTYRLPETADDLVEHPNIMKYGRVAEVGRAELGAMGRFRRSRSLPVFVRIRERSFGRLSHGSERNTGKPQRCCGLPVAPE
jgi:hypothetical protein